MNHNIEKLMPDLTSFTRSYIKNAADAEDVLQDALLKIHANSSGLQNVEKLKSWALAILRNTIFDYFKAQKKSSAVELDDDIKAFSVEVENLNETLFECVEMFASRLEEPYQEAIAEVYFKDVSQTELAEIKSLSVSGMKSRVQRGREKIKRQFAEHCELEFDRCGNLVDYRVKKRCN